MFGASTQRSTAFRTCGAPPAMTLPQSTRNGTAHRRPRFGPRRAASFVILTALLSTATSVWAQFPLEPGHTPLHAHMPTGWAAQWARSLRPQDDGAPQPVRIVLPDVGRVTFFAGAPDRPQTVEAPAELALQLGRVYRFRISHMPQYPGVELYPTIEVIDRLHPPAGHEWEFPVPVVFTDEDIRHALQGRLVTRVVYLEQPQLAATATAEDLVLPRNLPPNDDPFEIADRLGRPLLVVRLGGRVPAVNEPPEAFFGTFPPFWWKPADAHADPKRMAPARRRRTTEPAERARQTARNTVSTGQPARSAPRATHGLSPDASARDFDPTERYEAD